MLSGAGIGRQLRTAAIEIELSEIMEVIGMTERVIRLDDMTVYSSAAGAAAAIGANRSSVIRAIREGRACKGVHFAALPSKLDGFDVSSDVVRMWCAGEVLRRSGVDVAVGAAEWADAKVDRMIKYGEK